MAWRARELAETLGLKLVGDDVPLPSPPRPLEEAGEEDWTVLFSLPYRGEPKKVLALLAPEVVETLQARAYLLTPHPRKALAEILRRWETPPHLPEGVHPGAWVHPSARIAPDVRVGPGVWIGPEVEIGEGTWIFPHVYVGDGVRIGRDCRIYPHVTLYPGTVLGDRVILHAGSVIGSDGFGYVLEETPPKKIPQIGRVVIEDDVEIGANTTVDRATLGETRIRRGAKIDNLVQIAHNVEVGEHTVIAAQTGIAGSSRVGRRVILAGQVGIADHVRVGDGAIVTAATGVSKDVSPGEVVSSGFHALPRREHLRLQALYRRLPEIWSRLKALEKQVDRT